MRAPELTSTASPAPPGQPRHHGLRGAIEVLGVLVGLNVAVFLVALATAGSVSSTVSSPLIQDGGLYGPAVDAGEWWRVVTSGFLQVGWGHLISNMVALVVLGIPLINAIGPVRMLLVYLVSLLGGSLLALVFSADSLTVGASGAVFGVAGAAITVGWAQRRIFVTAFAGLWVAANFLLSLSSPANISISGHLGGVLAGALLGWLFVADSRRLRSGGVSVAIALAVGAGLFLASLAVA